MIKIFKVACFALITLISFAANSQDAADLSFSLIQEKCAPELDSAVKDIMRIAIKENTLPNGTEVVFPDTMSDQYFNVTFQHPDSSVRSVYEFSYSLEYESEEDANPTCIITPEGFIY